MYKRRINVRGIIYSEGKIYAQKLRSKTTGKVQSYWSTPGGGMDNGESIEAGLVREMIEETGVKPEIGKLLLVQQFHDGKKEQLEFFFHITNAKDYESVDLSTTTHGEIEVKEHGFIDPAEVTLLPKTLHEFGIATLIAEGQTRIVSEL